MLGPPMSIPTEQVMLCFSLWIQLPPGVADGGSSDGGGGAPRGRETEGRLGEEPRFLERFWVQVWAARTSSSNPELRKGTAL